MNITITDAAREKISSLCKINGKFVRLLIESGGCQGFNKKWDFTETPDVEDVVIDCGNGHLVIDEGSVGILGTCIIDYKNELSGSYFAVEIPSATSTCGCGTSFSL